MHTLSLQGVRCFGERQDLPIRPVTLLVGENSTGKTTVLAMVRAAWDLAQRGVEPDFNEEPFDLGSYEAIAYRPGGRPARVVEFRVEASFSATTGLGRSASSMSTVSGVFTEQNGQPFLSVWEKQRSNTSLSIVLRKDTALLELRQDEAVLLTAEVPRLPGAAGRQTVGQLDLSGLAPPSKSTLSEQNAKLQVLGLLPGFIAPREPRPIASAPIRSKPVRTYNPKRESQEPEGSHVPMELATLHGVHPAEFEELAEQLAAYGKDANLFSKLQVKRLGKKAGDPFQLLVAVDRHAFNLRDVGYGVSQVLPILVDTLTAPKGQTFLLQQPEVHLHPRAQAALGSLLVQQAARRKQRFVVETHSDHLVDRVRMDIRDGRSALKPSDVVILYFERVAGKATVHPISIDSAGNLGDVPPGYRAFFLEEERRMLGV